MVETTVETACHQSWGVKLGQRGRDEFHNLPEQGGRPSARTVLSSLQCPEQGSVHRTPHPGQHRGLTVWDKEKERK